MATGVEASGENAGNANVETRRAGTTRQRLEALEDENTRLSYVAATLEEKVEGMESEIVDLHAQLDESRQACRTLVEAYGGSSLADMRRQMEAMSVQIGLLQRAVANGPVGAPDPMASLRVPEPKAYGGQRDAKEVENFLFDMEQYFLAANIRDEGRKVATATMYLSGDAKLWWRMKYGEVQAERVRMDTWPLLKAAIRQQFFPENVEYNARRALRELRHTGSTGDYVKAFSAHMLDITDMSEKDKLFTFLEGLKPWARAELQRQRVEDVSTAMGAAERLMDYSPEPRRNTPPSSSNGQPEGEREMERSFRPCSSKGGGERQPCTKSGSQGSSNRNRPQGNKPGTSQTSNVSCFLCDGPHTMKDCPTKQLLNALSSLAGGESTSKNSKSKAKAKSVQESDEEEEAASLGAIQWRPP